MYTIIRKDIDVQIVGHIINRNLFADFIYNQVKSRFHPTILKNITLKNVKNNYDNGYYLIVNDHDNEILLIEKYNKINKGYIWDTNESKIDNISKYYLVVDNMYRQNISRSIKKIINRIN